MVKIHLDAGHGGKDCGAIGFGMHEADYVLMQVKAVRNYLLANYENVQVQLTRSTDVFVELAARAKMANKWEADLFVSFHLNASGGKGHGYETFVHSKASAGSKKLQEAIHLPAYNVIKSYGEVFNRGEKTANYAVLRLTNMPAVLIETLFIDNEADNKLLKNDAFTKDVIESYAKSIAKYAGLKSKNEVTEVKVDKVVSDPATEVKSETVVKPSTLLKKGSKGDAVEQLQENLNKLGFDCGKADGVFGTKTQEAVKKLQAKLKLSVDGVVGVNTLAAITKALLELAKEKVEDKPVEKKEEVKKEMPKVTSLGDKYSFQVKAKKDIGVYKFSDLSEKQKSLKSGTIFSVYGYSEGVKAYAVGGGGFVQAADVEPIPLHLRTGGLNSVNEKIFRDFLKENKIDSELNLYHTGNPSADIEVAGLDLVAVKKFLDKQKWYYNVK